MFARLFGVLFPDRCVGCRVRGTLLCVSCQAKLAPVVLPLPSFVTSVFSHKDPRVRKLIHLLKYQNTKHAAVVFARPLAEALLEILGDTILARGVGRVVLVPIPLSAKRYKMRGYNQSEVLARAIAKQLLEQEIAVVKNLLIKTTDTLPQASVKSRKDRLQNLGECFAVNTKVPLDSRTLVILVDDVTTTGTTLEAARAALHSAGYYKVYALTVSH